MRAARLQTREAFQASRGIAILIVVIFHADLALAVLKNYQTFVTVREALRYIPMPLFFLSVGMALAPAFDRGHAPAHLTRRAVHYGYLFLVWTVIDIVITSIISINILTFRAVLWYFIHPDSVLWFLYGLALQLLVFGIIANLSKAFQVITALMIAFLSNYVHSPVAFNTSSYMIFLVIGARFGPALQNWLMERSRYAVMIFVPAYVLILIVTAGVRYKFSIYMDTICSILGIMGLVGLLRFFMTFYRMSFLRYLGRSTFGIYIFHFYFVVLCVHAAKQADINVQGNTSLELVLTLSVLVFAVCGSLLVGHGLRRFNWLFSKPNWVVTYIEPPLVAAIQNINAFWSYRSLSDARIGARPR